jgi:hypothetical protein
MQPAAMAPPAPPLWYAIRCPVGQPHTPFPSCGPPKPWLHPNSSIGLGQVVQAVQPAADSDIDADKAVLLLANERYLPCGHVRQLDVGFL